ncbi:hypothetical protein BGZ61DRAFT_374005 [Ilyonectria robusta]|uniref:uncharacterized protein n=1 Tax=Ilyonectria robusta TaxID=1079257 RepID=UPI001E8EB2AA|nr:uncharacterized protein BGZ61DRAFT_374005 [Ilyonectria robusta]KAH8654161.1 hypothetical protein BGZ61DRAFT_374005 [Ilyonectria robusta]
MGSRILIVGAGSMGVIVGYHLSLAGSNVTFLARPYQIQALERPQTLYCYDDNELKEFNGYNWITDPTRIIGADYDYIFVTLDGASLRNETGQRLVKTIGEAARGTNTKVILGSVFINLRSWFLQISGIGDEQIINGFLAIHAYSTKAVTLPTNSPTDPDLISEADLAYSDRLGQGLVLDDSSPGVANGFAEIYNASGVSSCVILPAVELALLSNPMFAVFAACELTNWPKFRDISSEGELWSLTVAAVKEIQRLSIHGEPGQQAARQTTEDEFAASLAAREKQMLPLDWQAFNRYHHGAKVNAQDREHLHACQEIGETDGKPMSALRELLQRVEARQG